ncbi:uncharacterized protein B0H18DRAFT_1127302 [Fomitopsis serialis]|uniref:uncharacterized protein n=1 Tax=Fomitopsis serialis TaxID=139415 RepID=UPI002007ABF4|nr:uncharacterized protein B0H18DRAFT_1127302 [Neoantrodia serialis]KAH9912320.1 hypothetical protein B0H18DRAFT_1127302 [Neoantrodia serialis]
MASPAPPSSPGVNGVVTSDDRNDTVLFTDLSVEERLSRLEALSAEHAATLRGVESEFSSLRGNLATAMGGLFHALDTVDRRSLRQVTEFRTSFAEFRRLADEAQRSTIHSVRSLAARVHAVRETLDALSVSSASSTTSRSMPTPA